MLSVFIFTLIIIAMLFGILFALSLSDDSYAYALDKSITITANNKEQVYGQQPIILDYVITGDSITLEEENLLNIRLTKSEGGETGEYVIMVSCDEVTGIVVNKVNGVYTIIPAIFDTRDLSFTNQTHTYDGDTKSILVEGYIPSEIDVIYASNGQSEAGEYLVSAIFSGSSNYVITGGTRYATLSIQKAYIDISGMIFNSGTFTYDGFPKSLKVVGTIPDNVTIRYKGNIAQTAGTYRVTAIVDYNKNNYKLCSGEYELTNNHLYADIIINKARSIINVKSASYSKVYDGTPFSIPAKIVGESSRNMVYIVNETLSSNQFTDVGNYRVVITTIGTNNYLPAQEVSVDVKILTPMVASKQQNFDVLLLSSSGFEAGMTIMVTQSMSALMDKESPLRKISTVYTILLFCNGEIVDIPSDTTVVITPPKGRNLSLYYNNSGTGEQVPFLYNGQNQMVFQAKELGMFVIYEDDYQLYWIIGLLVCIVAIFALIIAIALYRAKKYKIEFVSNIIDYEVAPLVAGIGQPITIPNANYGTLVFDGWYLDNNLKNKLVKLEYMPKKNIKLFAKWSYLPIGKYRKFTDLELL